jgi:hypothetical protein
MLTIRRALKQLWPRRATLLLLLDLASLITYTLDIRAVNPELALISARCLCSIPGPRDNAEHEPRDQCERS